MGAHLWLKLIEFKIYVGANGEGTDSGTEIIYTYEETRSNNW